MEDLWKRARLFAEDAAKKSQTLTTTLTTTSSSKIADLVSETAKKSKEIAVEATKKADQLRSAALKQADQIPFKSISDIIPPQLASSLSSISNADVTTATSSSSSSVVLDEEELKRFGITDDLREFVKGLTSSTFKNFPVQDEPEESDVPTTASNVRKDLSEWRERHATLVLSTVKHISRLRYDLCPRVMKERRFWRIYFTLVSTHVSPYERQYVEEAKRKAEEQMKEDKAKSSPATGETSGTEEKVKNEKSKTSRASSEQDLDTFLLGDLEDSDGGGQDDDGDVSFDDDFDKIENSDVEEERDSDKASVSATS